MSQLSDLRKIFREAPARYDITQDQAADLFLKVLDACEWDALNINCVEQSPEDDRAVAKGFLFGEGA